LKNEDKYDLARIVNCCVIVAFKGEFYRNLIPVRSERCATGTSRTQIRAWTSVSGAFHSANTWKYRSPMPTPERQNSAINVPRLLNYFGNWGSGGQASPPTTCLRTAIPEKRENTGKSLKSTGLAKTPLLEKACSFAPVGNSLSWKTGKRESTQRTNLGKAGRSAVRDSFLSLAATCTESDGAVRPTLRLLRYRSTERLVQKTRALGENDYNAESSLQDLVLRHF